MAVSGVQIPRTIIDSFQDLKIKKAHRYMLITLDESGTSLKAKTGARKTTAADFKKEFSAKECAFGVFDHPDNQRLIFVHWNPDNAPVKSKMASAAAAKAVQDALEGLGNMLQVTDAEELAAACQ